jgi:hypothetical protein
MLSCAYPHCNVVLECRFKKGGRGWKSPFKNEGSTAKVRDEIKSAEQVRFYVRVQCMYSRQHSP